MSLTGTENFSTAANSTFGCSDSSRSWSYNGSSSKNSSTHVCIMCDSLLSVEREDSECISDSKPYGCSSEDPSTPLGTKCDSSSMISDLDKASYWDTSLNLEGEGCEWISYSAPELECFWDGFPSTVSTVSSLTEVHCNRSEDNNISVEHLLEIEDMEEFSGDGPLFWPFEGKFNWNSEEMESWSLFSISPRRRLVFGFGSRSTISRTRNCKQKGDEDVCGVKSEPSRISMSSKNSAKIVTSELNDDKVVLKRGEVPKTSNKPLSLDKTFVNEDYALNKDLPLVREDFSLDQEPEIPIETLVGLKEFDGHEGLDSEFNGDAFMLEESLLIIQPHDCVVSKQGEEQA